MGDFDSFLTSPVFLRLVQLLAVLSLVGAIGGVGIVLAQIGRAGSPSEGDRNWRFLFSCWGDSVAIMILYASINFIVIFERFAQYLQSAAYYSDPYPLLASGYALLVLEFVIYAVILIVAARLFLRIRRHLQGA